MHWLICYAIYVLFRFVFSFYQNIIDIFLKSKNNFRKSYETSATVETILFRYKPNLAYTASGCDFITYKAKTAHPNYVLKDCVSLYAIDNKEAYFIECSPEINVYSSDVNPFLYAAQFAQARRVIRMPLESFRRLANELGEPSIPTIVVWSTGRCGSTLLNQIFESISDNVICMGEPDALTNLIWMRGRCKIDMDQYKVLLKSSLCLILKPRKKSTRLICMKVRSSCTQHLTTCYNLFPQDNIKHIFIYRDLIPNCQSLEQSLMSIEPMGMWWYVKRSLLLRLIFPRLADIEITSIAAFVSLDPEAYKWIVGDDVLITLTDFELWAVHWGIICAEYQKAQRVGVPVIGLHYDDLVNKTEKICEQLNVKLSLEVDDIWRKVGLAMQKDSQRGTVLSRVKLDKRPRLMPLEEELSNINTIFERMNINVSLKGRVQLRNTIDV